ncbi:type I methionyl aminopeptidase [Pseudonocardia bannensis]|uniref:type I methionyl aminopeptidase n=1 Tax=Pseudonocardia bannensis TaxID=630973 RepID=UPI0028B12029|nr:type I methionyl aminopeptidase [Pseudonocardia bannensis]
MNRGRRGVRGALARLRGRDIEIKSRGELEAMRAAGALVAATLKAVTELARPGVSTAELDALAEQTIRDAGAVPSFLGYHGYPASICASVNEQIVHGIPSAGQILAEGDLISVDCGAILEGWHGDAAVTIPIGTVSAADLALSAACEEALYAGIAAVQAGARLSDISHAVQVSCEKSAHRDRADYGIVAEYGGHGIGSSMHMDPFLPNFGDPGQGPRLKPGMALAVEPMLTAGDPETRELSDGWTVVTADGSRAVHWEHSVAVTEDGPWLLTAPAD